MKKILQKIVIFNLSLIIFSFGTINAAETAYISNPYEVSVENDLAARQIIARLDHALDEGDYKLYGSFFATDGVFASGFGDATGPKEVAAALEKVSPFITNKRHTASNLVINQSGKEIIVTSYLTVFERKSELKYVGSAVNVDTLGFRDGELKVVRHDSTLDPATAAYIQSIMAK